MRLQISALVAAIVATAACSDDTTDPTPICTVSTVTITGAPTELDINGTAQLTANVTSEDCTTAPTVAWTTSSGTIATVSATGLVTGKAAGEVTITATAGGKSGTATFDVATVPIAAVRLVPDSIVIGTGTGPTLRAEVLDANDNLLEGRTVTWSSQSAGNANVSNAGVLTGITAGTSSEIQADAEGFSGTAMVHVVRPQMAFLWNNLAAPVGAQVPDPFYSFNSEGGALGISSGGVGEYTASYGGFTSNEYETEALFTSIYGGPSGAYCRIDNWSSASVDLNCHAADGTLQNNTFNVAAIGAGSLSGRSAFAWIASGGATEEASWAYRYNPTGGNIISTRTALGAYTLRFENLGRAGAADREAIIVNSYGGNGGATCQPASWTTTGTHLDVEVRCFNAAGAPADSPYTILLADGARNGARLGFAHADQPASATYTPANSAVRGTGSVVVSRNATGVFNVEFENFYRGVGQTESFLVVATGPNPGRCSIGGWDSTSDIGGSASISVFCATPGGTPADLPFSIVALQ